MEDRPDDDEALVRAAQGGDEAAFTVLFRRWFDPCFDVAWRILRDQAGAADIAQDTFLSAWTSLGTLRDPKAFGGWVLRAARNKALNRLERERRAMPVDDEHPVLVSLPAGGADVGDVVAAGYHRDLLWAAAAALGERDASVLDLHLRHGLDASELADELGVTTNNAHQLVFRMKQRLAGAIRAWVVYADGSPDCEQLAALLTGAGSPGFDAATVKIIDRHVAGCDVCRDREEAVVAPEALFAGVPLLMAPVLLRDRVVDALRAAGVPLGPDAATPPPGQPGSPGAGAGDAVGRRSGDDAAPGGGAGTQVGARVGGELGPERAEGTRRGVLVAAIAAVVLLVVVGLLAVSRRSVEDVRATGAAAAPSAPPTAAVGTSSPPGTAGGTPRSGDAPPGSADTALDLVPPGPTVSTLVPADGAPAVTPPPVVGPTTTAPVDPATTEPTPTTTAPVPPPPPPPSPPTIDSFSATVASAPGGACPGTWAVTLTWTSTGATSAEIAVVGGSTITGLPVDGTTVSCRPTPSVPAGTYRLRVQGAGGEVTRAAP